MKSKFYETSEDDGWKIVIDFTQIDKEGVSAKQVIEAISKPH